MYLNPAGKTIGTLKTNFSNSLSAPSYVYSDLRHGTGHGIEYKNNQLILVKYKKNGTKKTKVLSEKFNPESLVVGCQGLHYYLISNFDKVKNKTNIPIKFLTPGKLDYYNFKLDYVGMNKNGLIELKIKISNPILRFFAPELNIFYNPNNKRLVEYVGLSNISDKNDKNQSVRIVYQY